MTHLRNHEKVFISKGGDIRIEELHNRALLALQGPKATAVLQKLVKEEVNKLPFMWAADMRVGGINCLVSRCGYTGEDGFEISVPANRAVDLASMFLTEKEVLLAGLGARDSLRLEAGLCLYGHELNEHITPLEAGLLWCIGKRRRQEGGFLGFEAFQKQVAEGVKQKRVGLLCDAPAREHTEVQSLDGKKIGEVTSGTMSPSLKAAVSMAYVETPFAKEGTELKVVVRNKFVNAKVTKLPFVPTRYFKGSA
eukprot:TRINITY_DN661_c0_g1_i4.p1 TRINITY_DN661_c0_g1~~TRINITY_DN661_c0_g1_i4.p1  ORF type:complete len:296 (-),score=122.39 TRINITY_DN661_c0_g1_i4:102-857(-)